MDNFQTPILFLIFNRPDTSQKVFEKIKKIKPKYLYVSADGARINKDGEKEKCLETRKIIEGIDWECELKTNFSDENLGCKRGVTKGINWFFENVEQGIILEDDCLPDISFFNFCSEMLNKYKYDKNIMHIGGTNFQDGKIRGDGSYYFSRLVHVWGWATWQRAWKLYDVNIKSFNESTYDKEFSSIIKNEEIRNYYKKFFNTVANNKLDTWDFQWVFTVWDNNGMSIIPNTNLIENIGFGSEATHTKDSNELSNIKTNTLKEILHPNKILVDEEADEYTYFAKIKKSKLTKIIELLKSKIK